MTRFGAQFRVARAFLDFVSGVDPSGVGLVRALLTVIPRRPARRGDDDTGKQHRARA